MQISFELHMIECISYKFGPTDKLLKFPVLGIVLHMKLCSFGSSNILFDAKKKHIQCKSMFWLTYHHQMYGKNINNSMKYSNFKNYIKLFRPE